MNKNTIGDIEQRRENTDIYIVFPTRAVSDILSQMIAVIANDDRPL